MPATQTVDQFLQELEHPMKDLILDIRNFIKDSDNQLDEHIKWNAPSFCLQDTDIITMKLFPPKRIQVIFHRGAKVKAQPENKLINDESGILKWATNDRAIATFNNQSEFDDQKAAFAHIIAQWIKVAV
ncbi:DUF1801 domain-containing protein [Fulvivirga ligni]|uniref:DUF1801 domain-containing protein n=1 Tax=Fulvivirga ligni TaxID=2904246 RepID=UPI001F399085|nr:DUF1801 domain-containing protein [Fulvivirga ligni]UII19179.1 DUF1801 domain-containing protein [Fulvivirga ligni]